MTRKFPPIFFAIFASAFFVSSLNAATPKTASDGMNTIAEAYVKLVLAMGQHDADYVDAYYGPAQWKDAAMKEKKSLDAIGAEAKQLVDALQKIPAPAEEMERLRREYLTKQLLALETYLRIVKGERLKFDEESRLLYDAVAPTFSDSHFQKILDQLEKKIPGSGPLTQRYDQWRKLFVIPKEKLDTVFQLAINECRRRTLAHIKLPPNESFTVEYVTKKPWSAYNWYKGNYRSVIQVNTDLPVYIDRAIDLAAHEGYPGHHVYNALLEKNLVRDRGWVEFSVYPLFSPQSLVAEGTANFRQGSCVHEAGADEVREGSAFSRSGNRPCARGGILCRGGNDPETELRAKRIGTTSYQRRDRCNRGCNLVGEIRPHGSRSREPGRTI